VTSPVPAATRAARRPGGHPRASGHLFEVGATDQGAACGQSEADAAGHGGARRGHGHEVRGPGGAMVGAWSMRGAARARAWPRVAARVGARWRWLGRASRHVRRRTTGKKRTNHSCVMSDSGE
jgi:hypothetical protein